MAEKQTSVRLDPAIQESVKALKKVHRCTFNKLVNEALAFYIDHIIAQKTIDLDDSRTALRAFIASDPGFEAAIDGLVSDTEISTANIGAKAFRRKQSSRKENDGMMFQPLSTKGVLDG